MRHVWTIIGSLLVSGLILVQAAAQGVGSPGVSPRPKPPENDRPYNVAHPSPESRPAPAVGQRPTTEQRDQFGGTTDFRYRDQQRFDQDQENADRSRQQKANSKPGQRAFIRDFGRYGLSAPPPNAMWVRVGSDAVLLDQKSGAVTQTRRGVFNDPLALPEGETPPTQPPAP